MNLYLDTEFDGHGGALISLALAAEEGVHWYGVWPTLIANEWVASNVYPKLIKPGFQPTLPPGHDVETLRASLKEYLLARSGATIWADWPDDFVHLMRLMSGPSYEQSFVVPCTMRLIETPPGEPKPEIPHNALSDAIALMQWHQSTAATAFVNGGTFRCAARPNGSPHLPGGGDPQECDWPVCGCDEYANEVIAALQESGHVVQPEVKE